jgi:hypothetical protein
MIFFHWKSILFLHCSWYIYVNCLHACSTFAQVSGLRGLCM